MLYLAVITTLLLIVSILLCVYAFILAVKARRLLLSFFMPAGQDKPSVAAGMIDSVSQMFARSLMAEAKTTLMGIQSGISRGTNKELEEQMAGSNPYAAILMALLPKTLKAKLAHNPALFDMAAAKLLHGGQNSTQAVSGSPSNGSSNWKKEL